MPLSPSGGPRYGPRYRGGSYAPSFRKRRGPSRFLLVLVLLALIIGGGAGGFFYVAHQRALARDMRQAEAVQITRDYLAAWTKGDAAAAGALATDDRRAAATALLTQSRADLHATAFVATATGPVTSEGTLPGVGYTAKVTSRGLGDATWQGRVPLRRVGDTWRVEFAPAVVHPLLPPGGRFAWTRPVNSATRGKVRAASGESLATIVGLASPEIKGDVGTLKTDADAAKLGPLFLAGDDTGVSGLQKAFNGVLQGSPGGSLRIVDPAKKTVATLIEIKKKDGKDVATTFTSKAEAAVQMALAGVPATFPLRSMVVLDASTGGVLATGGGAVAYQGTYPPGSTFKVVTSVAALASGLDPGTSLDCSKNVTINGRSFHNAEGESFGPLSFATAFAKSCNTWFARLAAQVAQQPGGVDKLVKAAQLFGFQTDADHLKAEAAAKGVLPIASFGGTYPRPKDLAQVGGQAFGQDLVLASPLQMASVAAAIAGGTWHAPRVTMLTRDVAHPLPAGAAQTVRGFMAGVVGGGGTAGMVGFPGGVVGKTGTAETTGGKEDSWFIALRGNVAVACEVDHGGFGADVAAPAVSRFFSLYPG